MNNATQVADTGYAIDDRAFCAAGTSSQGAIDIYVGAIGDGTTYLQFELSPSGLWAASANVGIRGQLFYEGAEY